MKEATKVYQKSSSGYSDTESDEESEEKNRDGGIRIPKVCTGVKT